MSRPIPEGVEAPHPNAVTLGWGKEFIVPDHGFNGWMSFSARGQWLVAIGMKGVNPDCLYAADRDSEVALLNRKPVPLNSGEAYSSEVVRVNQKPKGRFNINLEQLASDLKEQGKQDREMLTREPPDKDALIREMVGAIQGFQKLLEDGPENASFTQCEDALVAAADTLTLARTTCPELF